MTFLMAMMTSNAGSNRQPNRRLTAVLRVLFFMLGSTWLLAPFFHHARYGHLHFISNYEGLGQQWGWVFRLGDVASALILAILIYRYCVWRKDHLMSLLLFAIAALAAVDAIFPVTCQPGITHMCIEKHSLSTDIHYLESSISAVAIGLAVLLDAWRRRKMFSILFFIIQIIFIIFAQTHGISSQILALLQYVYEVVLMIWLLYLLEAYEDSTPTRRLLGRPYRMVLAAWVGLSGVLAIVISAAHLHLYGPGITLYFGGRTPWIAQQAAFVGVMLLYLARQIYRGQRRAAYLLFIIFGFELFKYSLIEPHPILAPLYGLTFVLLFIGRKSFVRNVGPINMHRRLYDLLVVLGGIALALGTISVILLSLGRFNHVVRIIDNGSDYLTHQYRSHREDIPIRGQRVRQTAAVLATSTLAISAWIIFRPSRFNESSENPAKDRQRAERILRDHSHSSEDYFKLWPQDKAYFFAADSHGFIAYKITRGIAFALADPVAPTLADRRSLLKAFNDFCTANGWSMCFIPVNEAFKTLYTPLFSLLPIGSGALVDIREFNEKTRHDKWWRWKRNQAVKAGLSYEVSHPPHTPELLYEFKDVSEAWLQHGGRREQGFALGYFDLHYLNRCRIHYLLDEQNKVVAFTNELPVFSGEQATVDLLRYVPTQDAAMPYLLMSLIERLGTEGMFATFDLGFVPLAQVNNRYAQLTKAIAKTRFSASGLEQFKGKFRPHWTPYYIAYNGDILDLAALAISLEATFKHDPKS
jgi:phosphatidylglycerol lysyltransferase